MDKIIIYTDGSARGNPGPGGFGAILIWGEKVKEIAEVKMPDLNANDIDAAMKIIEGTARQMGITVSE